MTSNTRPSTPPPATTAPQRAWHSAGPALAAIAFAGTIVAANTLTRRYGLIDVGFGLIATAGTAAAGLTLLTRDWLHDVAGRRAVLAAIGVGAAVSAALTGGLLACASAAAFLLAELTDLLVYQRLRRHGWIPAALASNMVGAPVDTVVFLALAGLPVWAALPGQLWVKALATVVPLIVVAVARALLRHRLRPARP
jgi:uncharacterized PurR-regulated membrane protein YhhQ (DUF165 family)